MKRQLWVVHIHGRIHEFGYVGYLYVATREQGRELCRALRAAGADGFVVRSDQG